MSVTYPPKKSFPRFSGQSTTLFLDTPIWLPKQTGSYFRLETLPCSGLRRVGKASVSWVPSHMLRPSSAFPKMNFAVNPISFLMHPHLDMGRTWGQVPQSRWLIQKIDIGSVIDPHFCCWKSPLSPSHVFQVSLSHSLLLIEDGPGYGDHGGPSPSVRLCPRSSWISQTC
jgi:hypothetical protein